jgi:hypothetical protein
MSRASLGTAARGDETNRLGRSGRGSNYSPGSLLYTRWIKMDASLEAPGKIQFLHR